MGVSEPIKLETVLVEFCPPRLGHRHPLDHCTLVGSMLGRGGAQRALRLLLTNSQEILDERFRYQLCTLRLRQPGKLHAADGGLSALVPEGGRICAHGLLEHGGRTDGLLLDRHHGGPACLRARLCHQKSACPLQKHCRKIANRRNRTAQNQKSVKIRRQVDPKTKPMITSSLLSWAITLMSPACWYPRPPCCRQFWGKRRMILPGGSWKASARMFGLATELPCPHAEELFPKAGIGLHAPPG